MPSRAGFTLAFRITASFSPCFSVIQARITAVFPACGSGSVSAGSPFISGMDGASASSLSFTGSAGTSMAALSSIVTLFDSFTGKSAVSSAKEAQRTPISRQHAIRIAKLLLISFLIFVSSFVAIGRAAAHFSFVYFRTGICTHLFIIVFYHILSGFSSVYAKICMILNVPAISCSKMNSKALYTACHVHITV